MKFLVKSSKLNGETGITSSKSNTTRAVFLSTLASGESVIRNPLNGRDCLSTVAVCRLLGAEIETGETLWKVKSKGFPLEIPSQVLNAGNSGTTYYISLAVMSLIDGYSVISGDHQIRRRPTGPLLEALNDLGALAISTTEKGVAPCIVKGVMKGGKTSLPGVNSQWLSPLLIASPLAGGDSEIRVRDLRERPYIRLTFDWLDRLGIEYSEENMEYFRIKGGQHYKPFDYTIPGDWESASFVLVAAAITDSDITITGMDTTDSQGDKAIVEVLKEMGADITVVDHGRGGIRVRGGRKLKGIKVDCGDLPDAPPILSVLGSQAEGKMVLTNLGASRLKETDRTGSICGELSKMGARLQEDGNRLTIYPSSLKGAHIDGRRDHRIVMSTAVAAFKAQGETLIENAEYTAISFPTFYQVMKGFGADITAVKDGENSETWE